MSEILRQLNERDIPDIFKFTDGEDVSANNFDRRRDEIIQLFSTNVYGISPKSPKNIRVETTRELYNMFADKADVFERTIFFDTDEGEFSFPITEYRPKYSKPMPCILHIGFDINNVYHRHHPIEDIIDAGILLITFNHECVSTDNGDFSKGIAAKYDRNKYTWGKIAMWAFAASRAMDYITTLNYVDKEKTAVLGHSRLGKTALWCAVNDDRFKYMFANNSGCSGIAVSRGKTGETVDKIVSQFPFWFCDRYRDFSNKENLLPIDHHMLIAAIAPRKVCVGNALLDEWADPKSEFLSVLLGTAAFELFGKRGIPMCDDFPTGQTSYLSSDLGYFIRDGHHFLSKNDWQNYISFLKA